MEERGKEIKRREESRSGKRGKEEGRREEKQVKKAKRRRGRKEVEGEEGRGEEEERKYREQTCRQTLTASSSGVPR